jgi:hypothetical protein
MYFVVCVLIIKHMACHNLIGLYMPYFISPDTSCFEYIFKKLPPGGRNPNSCYHNRLHTYQNSDFRSEPFSCLCQNLTISICYHTFNTMYDAHTTRHLTACHLTTRHFSTRHPDNSPPKQLATQTTRHFDNSPL